MIEIVYVGFFWVCFLCTTVHIMKPIAWRKPVLENLSKEMILEKLIVRVDKNSSILQINRSDCVQTRHMTMIVSQKFNNLKKSY